MRIAQVAPLAESVPPRLYGGTERVVSWLTEALVDLGHEVTLFASGNSVTRAKHVRVWPRALRLNRPRSDPAAAQAALLEAVASASSEFDVIHCHIDWLHLPLLSRLGVPFLTTLHGRLDLPASCARTLTNFASAPFISISNAQRTATGTQLGRHCVSWYAPERTRRVRTWRVPCLSRSNRAGQRSAPRHPMGSPSWNSDQNRGEGPAGGNAIFSRSRSSPCLTAPRSLSLAR